MTTNELFDYQKEFLMILPSPRVIRLQRGQRFLNAENTANRKAYRDIPWIDYYRAFTDPTAKVFRCAGCGALISTDDIVDMDSDVGKAHGGHLLIGNPVGVHFFIVPLCPMCNNPSKKIIRIANATLAVEEVGATIDSLETD